MKRGDKVKKYNKLIGYRKMCGMTQKDMANVIGVSTAQGYGSKEIGKVPFTADEMQAIQNVLNSRLGLRLTIDELFFS